MRFPTDPDDDAADEAPDDGRLLDEEFPLGDGTADTEAELLCPWCGEPVTIALDPGSGATQEYVEDCQVCCRPWTVHVAYDEDGQAEVWAEAQGDWDD
jgi:hypothetical protein